MLTHDQRTSDFTQSPAAHSAQVDLVKLDGEVPEITGFDPPEILPEEPI